MEISEDDRRHVEQCIASLPDFPKPGIIFRDFMPCLRDTRAFRALIDTLSGCVQASGADLILAPEARGFIFGCPVAYKLSVPIVCARKPGKLPGSVVAESYVLEYGTATLEVQAGAITPGSKVFIMDDLLATGGTILALKRLAESQGATVVACGFVVELEELKARERIECPIHAIFQF
eukprot:Blabericola_migrator_1__13176@NODE_904_length_6135_cov_68_019281_g633_i0_p5_GENE_NODE_904_length_6135_cov_68_019281_g633_i0NODE_904_length_6135_cov_68_019281_g633_i0_p5_ORF_typecomplete_len178_score23_30Pribosyltran/PF00156_27/5_1e21Pribosyl_synth/PF14572_6/0_0043UPRTase/PF14681_6/0_033_NODE_904_length_6135_cov_68_019281_g633_i049555488